MKLSSLSPVISIVLTPLLVICPLWAQTPISAPAASDQSSAAPQSLALRLIGSDGTQTPAGSRIDKGFTVQVVDPSGLAVPEAAVVFRLPDTGSTGTFPDGTHSTVVYTDATGRAQITGIHWNETSGAVAIRVTATKGASHAGMSIDETLLNGVATTAAPASPKSTPAPNVTVVPVPILPSKASIATASVTGASALPQPGTPQPAAQQPSVSVSSTPKDEAPHHSHTKWLILAIVAAGAGAGIAFAGKGKSNNSNTTPSLGIGTPSISVGSPNH